MVNGNRRFKTDEQPLQEKDNLLTQRSSELDAEHIKAAKTEGRLQEMQVKLDTATDKSPATANSFRPR